MADDEAKRAAVARALMGLGNLPRAPGPQGLGFATPYPTWADDGHDKPWMWDSMQNPAFNQSFSPNYLDQPKSTNIEDRRGETFVPGSPLSRAREGVSKWSIYLENGIDPPPPTLSLTGSEFLRPSDLPFIKKYAPELVRTRDGMDYIQTAAPRNVVLQEIFNRMQSEEARGERGGTLGGKSPHRQVKK